MTTNNLKYKEYIGSIEYSEPDNLLFGKVLGLNRVLISYQGKNIDELKRDFIDGIENYLESCKEKGIKPPKSYTGAFNVRIPSEVHSEAVLMAQDEGITLNAFVRMAIEEKISKDQKTKRKRNIEKTV